MNMDELICPETRTATKAGGCEQLKIIGGAEGDRTPDLMTASHLQSFLAEFG
jgi:hypothetical protein